MLSRAWPVLGLLLACSCSQVEERRAGILRSEFDQHPSQILRSTMNADEALHARQQCSFGAGTAPGLSQARDVPLGTQIPIDTIVVVMMENRSFDHMLGNLRNYGQPDADVAPDDATNPDINGNPVGRSVQHQLCIDDTSHSWSAAHLEWNQGKNDGFVVANMFNGDKPADGARALSYFTENELPWFYSAVSNYAISDRYFCSALGPTQTNRAYVYAGTSFGRVHNDIFNEAKPTFMQLFEQNNVTWADYATNYPGMGIFFGTLNSYIDHINTMKDFFQQASDGALPQVSFVDPDLQERAEHNDLHPERDVELGQEFLANLVASLTASPQWPHMAIFITFDEHGGLYDHVPPVAACPPDDNQPQLQPGDTPGGDFSHTGFRVPLIAISPYAKPHYVSHDVTDHTSILRFIESRFNLPALTRRDANATPLFDLFDFAHPRLLVPPVLPTATVDADRLAACNARFP